MPGVSTLLLPTELSPDAAVMVLDKLVAMVLDELVATVLVAMVTVLCSFKKREMGRYTYHNIVIQTFSIM